MNAFLKSASFFIFTGSTLTAPFIPFPPGDTKAKTTPGICEITALSASAFSNLSISKWNSPLDSSKLLLLTTFLKVPLNEKQGSPFFIDLYSISFVSLSIDRIRSMILVYFSDLMSLTHPLNYNY